MQASPSPLANWNKSQPHVSADFLNMTSITWLSVRAWNQRREVQREKLSQTVHIISLEKLFRTPWKYIYPTIISNSSLVVSFHSLHLHIYLCAYLLNGCLPCCSSFPRDVVSQHSAWHTWWAHSVLGGWIPTIPILQVRELRAWQRRHFPKWHND